MRDVSARDTTVTNFFFLNQLDWCCFVYSFDYWHKKQSGGRGEYARVIGTVEVGGGWLSEINIRVVM